MSYDAVLVDAGTGNLLSVYNALKIQGFRILVSSNPKDLDQANRVILPGVGAFMNFMFGLEQRSLVEPLKKIAQKGVPFLGICVGMQALFDYSEEMGRHDGLSLLPGKVILFRDLGELKIPHTGWNQLWQKRKSGVLSGLENGCYAYFNHSFYCVPNNASASLVTTDYGLDFTSVIQVANLVGVQFHPEKSQQVGQKILANFMKI
jgi:imidazole glycerol-phosphate synthase subunit HisH